MKTYEECYFEVQDIDKVEEFLANKLCKACIHLHNEQVPSLLKSDNGKPVASVSCIIPLPIWFYTNENYLNSLQDCDEVLECNAYMEKQ